MSNKLSVLLSANEKYSSEYGDKSGLPAFPAKRIAVLTCMDSRLDPAKFAGLLEGDAHVIRNAGGRASDDAIRSLVISYKLYGTKEWFIIHHTNCGMESFTNQIMGELLESSLETSTRTENGWVDNGTGNGSTEGKYIEWLTFSDNTKSVIEDVERIRNHPLVPDSITVYGYILDIKTGKLIEVPEATEKGKST